MKLFNTISGFPRSGSTLLCNILNMNPEFHATATSPLMDMLKAQQASFSHNPSFKAADRLDMYEKFGNAQKSFIESFCDYDNKDYFDKNREWPSYIREIDSIFGHKKTKVLWCYRNPVHVIASMESAHKKTALIQHTEEAQQRGSMSTVAKRIDVWTNEGSFFARSMFDLLDAIESGYGNRILLVDYDMLCDSPQTVLDSIHDFLGIDRYNYSKNNFTDLKQTTEELDTFYNHKYPHTITEGAIAKSVPKPIQLDTVSNDYNHIIAERFKWVIQFAEKEKQKIFEA